MIDLSKTGKFKLPPTQINSLIVIFSIEAGSLLDLFKILPSAFVPCNKLPQVQQQK